MARLLFLAAIVAVVYLLFRAYRKGAQPGQSDTVTEDMVRCAQCGVHLPKSESVESDGQFFCGTGHRDAYRK